MRMLVFVRHGDYGKDGHLDDSGRKKIGSLAKNLRSLIKEGTTVKILTSMADRATESAEIISNIFNDVFEKHKILYSDITCEVKVPEVVELIKGQGAYEVVIVVTHLEYVEEFSRFVKALFGVEPRQPGHVPRSYALLFNRKDGEIIILRP